MAKPMLGDVIRDLNFLDDEWTICAKWPWTAKSEACVARTAADIGAAEARGLESFMDVAMARDLVEAMEPQTWMGHLIYHAEHRTFQSAA